MKVEVKRTKVEFGDYTSIKDVMEEVERTIAEIKNVEGCVDVVYECFLGWGDECTFYWVFYREETEEEKEKRVTVTKMQGLASKQRMYEQLKKDLGYEN